MRYPPAASGMRIGLLGGSFDPPHRGHVHITETALRRVGLDKVWWLVSPGNPLKQRGPAALDRRVAASNRLIDRHPDIVATDLESRMGTRYTADTIRKLRRIYPGVRFVWLMGADNLIEFHRWQHWTEIFQMIPIAVLARPGNQVRAGLSIAARRFGASRLPQRRAAALPYRDPPCWTLMTHPMSPHSSTAIRASGTWP